MSVSARVPVVVAVLVALAGVLLDAAPATASAKDVSIAIAPKGEYYSSSAAPFRATLSAAKKGTYARLQRLEAEHATRWTTIKKVEITRTGTKVGVAFGKVTTPPGRWRYRVVSDSSSALRAGTSTGLSAVHVVACDNYYVTHPRSAGTVTTAFSDPSASSTKTKRTTILALTATRSICTAAPGAVINLGMWDLDDDGLGAAHRGVVTPILGALDYVAHSRGVRVNFVIDAKTGMKAPTHEWLTQIAAINGGTYGECAHACISDRAWIPSVTQTGDAHQKLMTISKTTNLGGRPATFVSTSNWSYWQLRDYWNNSTVLWGNQKIFAAADRRLEAEIASAARPAGTLWSIPTAAAYGLQRSANYNTGSAATSDYAYVLSGPQERDGDVGTGSHIAFSPQQQSGDTILDQLTDVQCTDHPEDRIQAQTLFVDGQVGAKLISRINELKARKCKVQLVISKRIGNVKTAEDSYNGLRSALGEDLRCANLMHAKNTLINAHSTGPGSPAVTTVMTGPRNLNQGGWYDSDETMVRFTAGPTDPAAARVSALYTLYRQDFGRVWNAKTTVTCPPTYARYLAISSK